MLQRIQSLYLLASIICMGLLPVWLWLWKEEGKEVTFAWNEPYVIAVFILAALLSFISIFMFKNRKNQFVINRFNIILTLCLLGFFVYRSLNLSGEAMISEKGIGMFLPVISIVFLVLANRAIKRDEDLVKSVDRLR